MTTWTIDEIRGCFDEIEAKKIPKYWFGKEQKEKAHGLKDAALRERITKAIGE